MLQIGIDQHRSGTAAVGVVQPRQHRRLLAEVAGELQQRDGLVGMALCQARITATVASEDPSSISSRWSTSGKAMTRSMKALITSASLKQAATTHTCSLAINARSALFGTVGLPAQS